MFRIKYQYRNAVIVSAAVALVLAGCSDHENVKKHSTGILYSPNGEPLNGGPLGEPTCQQALSGWFDRVDTGHDGAISLNAFMADARAQFLRMDMDANGYIVSEELERYRRPYRKQAPIVPAPSDSVNTQHGKHKSHKDAGADSDDTPDSGDPVMSADTNLDFKVTPEEFMVHAQKIFGELDTNHDGALSRDEVLARCVEKKEE